MATYVIDNGSKYINELLVSLAVLQPILLAYDQLDPHAINDDDLVVLSGGHGYPVLWHDRAYHNEIEIIKNHKGPIIGICLGFELISHVFGSHLHHMKKRRRGTVYITPTTPNSIVENSCSLLVYENHTWSVEKVSAPLRALAVSADGIEVMQHISRPIFGMQFHPEGSGTDGNHILSNILRAI